MCGVGAVVCVHTKVTVVCTLWSVEREEILSASQQQAEADALLCVFLCVGV